MEKSNFILNTPVYQPSFYINEFFSRNPAIIRITNFALPFVSLYRPFNTPFFLCINTLHIVKFVKLIQQGRKPNNFALLQVGVATAALAGTLFAHPAGMMVRVIHDIGIQIFATYQNVQSGHYPEALESGISIVSNVIYLGVFIHGGVELVVASLAVQIIQGLWRSGTEFNTGHYLEGFGALTICAIRSYQLAPGIQLLKAIHENKKIPLGIPNAPFPVKNQSILPPYFLHGNKEVTPMGFESARDNRLTWGPSPSMNVVSYNIYRDGVHVGLVKAYEPLMFLDNNTYKTHTYNIRAQLADGSQSLPIYVTIPW